MSEEWGRSQFNQGYEAGQKAAQTKLEAENAELRASAGVLALYCQDKDRQGALQQTMILTLREALIEYSTDRHPSGIASESTCWADKALGDTVHNVELSSAAKKLPTEQDR